MQIGDTFLYEGIKYVIKNIDLSGNGPKNITGKPRIDASRMYVDTDGVEKIKLGRPKLFDPSIVIDILGEEANIEDKEAVKDDVKTIEPVNEEEQRTRVEAALKILGGADIVNDW